MKPFKKIGIKTILLVILALLILCSTAFAGFGAFADGLGGILLWPARFGIILIGLILGLFMGLASGSGATQLNIEEVLFNQCTGNATILDINMFNITAGANPTGIDAVKTQIAIWYVSLRNLSIVLIAIIAIYVGLRMALSTIAEDQAKYKKMLVDWVKSLALLFVMHIIMMLIIELNDALVKVMYNALQSVASSSGDLSILADYFRKAGGAFVQKFSVGFACAIAYLMLQIETFLFFITYIKRMVTIAFLITIAPLVTITYSIDKMKDGKSQAFDTWLKEYYSTVLVQPFHCVAYLVLGSSALKVMMPNGLAGSFDAFSPSDALPGLIPGLIMIGFILPAENIVRKIFNVQPNNIGDTAKNMALLSTLSKTGKNAAKFSGNALKNSKVGKSVTSKIHNSPKLNAFAQTGVGKALKKGSHVVGNANRLAFGIGAGIGIGGGTGKLETAILNASNFGSTAHEINKKKKEKRVENDAATAFNNYTDNTGKDGKGGTTADGMEAVKALLAGEKPEVDGAHGNTTELARAIDRLRDSLARQGVTDRSKQDASIMKTFTAISKGQIGEFAGSSFISPESFLGRKEAKFTRESQAQELINNGVTTVTSGVGKRKTTHDISTVVSNIENDYEDVNAAKQTLSTLKFYQVGQKIKLHGTIQKKQIHAAGQKRLLQKGTFKHLDENNHFKP